MKNELNFLFECNCVNIFEFPFHFDMKKLAAVKFSIEKPQTLKYCGRWCGASIKVSESHFTANSAFSINTKVTSAFGLSMLNGIDSIP